MKSDFFYDFGVGSILPGYKGHWKFEFGRQNYSMKGQLFSSFHSVIDYDLAFRSYFVRIGWTFPSSKSYSHHGPNYPDHVG